MGYILIIIGILAIICGIILLTHQKAQLTEPTQHKSKNSLETPATCEKDTIVVERVTEKIIEKDKSSEKDTSVKDELSVNNDIPNSSNPNKVKGDVFEDFVVNLLADWRLKLLDRTQDHKSTSGVVAESSKNPDLHIEQKRGKREIDYYIECKYRSNWDNGKVIFEDWQLDRYRQFQRSQRRKVIVALGVGGSPSSPSTLRLVPLDSIKNNYIREIDTKFAVQPKTAAFVEYMNTYFTDVFKVTKERKQNP